MMKLNSTWATHTENTITSYNSIQWEWFMLRVTRRGNNFLFYSTLYLWKSPCLSPNSLFKFKYNFLICICIAFCNSRGKLPKLENFRRIFLFPIHPAVIEIQLFLRGKNFEKISFRHKIRIYIIPMFIFMIVQKKRNGVTKFTSFFILRARFLIMLQSLQNCFVKTKTLSKLGIYKSWIFTLHHEQVRI